MYSRTHVIPIARKPLIVQNTNGHKKITGASSTKSNIPLTLNTNGLPICNTSGNMHFFLLRYADMSFPATMRT